MDAVADAKFLDSHISGPYPELQLCAPGPDVMCLQLITLYPGLMPSNSTFTRAVPPLHDIADVSQLCRGDAVKVQQCKKFLLNYLRHITNSSHSAADSLPSVRC